MSIETGVNLTLNDNGSSSVATKISDALEAIAKSADKINESLDTKNIDEYTKKLETLERTSKNSFQGSFKGSRQGSGLQNIVSSTGNSIAQAGRGDVSGAGITAGKTLASMLGGTAGMIGMIGLAGGAVTNKLAEGYESRTPQALKLATLQGRLSSDMEANTKQLRLVMTETVDSVSRYGKTYEEGAIAQEQFLRAGGKDFDKSKSGAFSLEYASDMGQLASFTGQTQRYGQEGSLEDVRSLLEAQGLGKGQFDEVLGGVRDTFSSFLSSGIIKPLEDIARTQAFFSQAGQTFEGSLGSQRLQSMNQTVAGASNLRGQDDIFLYRSAQKISEESGGGILETRKILEEGLTPELFKNLIKEYEDFGLNATESIIKLSDQFNISTTSAEKLYGLKDASNEAFETANGKALIDPKGTKETEYIKNIQDIKQDVAGGVGARAFDLRAEAVGVGAEISKGLREMFEDVDGMSVSEMVVETLRVKESVYIKASDIEQTGQSKINRATIKKAKDSALSGGMWQGKIYEGVSQERFNREVGKMWDDASLDGEITNSETSALLLAIQTMIDTTDKQTIALREAILSETTMNFWDDLP